MTGFQFRLASVVKLRHRERDTAAGSYQQAMAAKEKLLHEIEQIQSASTAVAPAAEIGRVDPQRLLETQRYQMYLQQEILQLQNQLRQIEQECERRRQLLIACEQKLKSLEKLEKRQMAEWQQRQDALQQTAVDGHASFQYWKRSQRLEDEDH